MDGWMVAGEREGRKGKLHLHGDSGVWYCSFSVSFPINSFFFPSNSLCGFLFLVYIAVGK